jgi:hypothetical protein
VKFCWRFGIQIADDVQANWQEGYCVIMTMPDPIQPKQPGREFKNCSGNFLNILLTVRTWPLETSICLVRKKSTLMADVSLMTKWLKLMCRSGGDKS